MEILNKSDNNSVIAIHNHPNNSVLSKGDLNNFKTYESIFRIEAIGNTMAVYKTNYYEINTIEKVKSIMDRVVKEKLTYL